MGYTTQFSDASTFAAAITALTADLRALQLPPLETNTRIRVDHKNQTIEFDGSSMELGVLFGNPQERETGKRIPFHTEAPTEEIFRRVAGERGISGVSIHRNEGAIGQTYLAEREKANTYFSTAAFPISSPSRCSSAREAFERAVTNNQPIVVNEAHGNQAHLRYVIDRIPQLGGKNYAITLEHFFIDQQPLLDAYLKSPPDAPIPRELAIYVDQFIDPRINETNKVRTAHVYTTRELLETAKRHGVRVHAIETEESFGSRAFRLANGADGASMDNEVYGLHDRLALMNYNVGKIDAYRRAANPDARLVSVAGASHGLNYIDPATSRTVPGLGRILGGETFFVIDPDNPQKTAPHITQDSFKDAYRNSDYVFTLNGHGEEAPVDLSPLGLSNPQPAAENTTAPDITAPDTKQLGPYTARHGVGSRGGRCR
jgi:hypothetical protein